jgi:hypothetical protein
MKVFCKAKFSFLSPIPPAFYLMTLPVGLPESSGGRIRSFPLSTSSFHHGSPYIGTKAERFLSFIYLFILFVVYLTTSSITQTM